MSTKHHSNHSSGCIIYYKLDNIILFLVAHQKKFNTDEYHFVSPKGIIEKGETSKQAALRETQEEVGIKTVNYITFLGTEDFFKVNLNLQWKTDWHLVESLNPSEVALQQEEGFVGAQWLNYQDAKATFTYESFLVYLDKAYIYINT